MASCPRLHPTTALQAGRSSVQQRKSESDAGRCCCATVAAGQVPRLRCRWAVLYRHDDYAAAIRKSGPEIKNRCTQKVVFGEILASIPKFGLEIKNRCTQESVNRQKLASIPKSGPEIKNRCTKEGVNRQNHALIPKSGPEIKNRCTQKDVSGEKLAAIRKSGPEIKNRCIGGGGGVLQAGHLLCGNEN